MRTLVPRPTLGQPAILRRSVATGREERTGLNMRKYPVTLLTLLSAVVLGLIQPPVFVQSADDIKAVMRVDLAQGI